MIEKILITEEELGKFGSGETLADKASTLLKQQYETWELLQKNYADLEKVEIRNLEFDGFDIKVQFNPGRIISSSAKVDKNSIANRKCFLCMENLPPDQRGILFGAEYLLLCNPFPIFPRHFTIPKLDHLPQQISGNLTDGLELSKELGKYYTVFYNGPKCGASAPDHMHYQAGNKSFMPIDDEYQSIVKKMGQNLIYQDGLEVYAVEKYLRNLISIESSDIKKILSVFKIIYQTLDRISKSNEEPMMNIQFYWDENKWRIIIFPRQKHRPSYYYEEGDKKILLSPAAVDLGGVCITPREEDFQKITKDQIVDIFRQISISKEYFEYLIKEVSNFGRVKESD